MSVDVAGGDDALRIWFSVNLPGTLFGSAGDDTLRGASGADNLEGGAGADHFSGGSGHDRALVSDDDTHEGVEEVR